MLYKYIGILLYYNNFNVIPHLFLVKLHSCHYASEYVSSGDQIE